MERPKLSRVLGLAFGLAVTVGVTIGAGILRRPGPVAGALADPALILLMWSAGGVYALFAAFTVAELAVALPVAGGFFIWARHAMGPAAGFAIGWCDFLANCATIAYASVAMAEILAAVLPAAHAFPKGIAVSVVLLFAAIQARGIRSGSRAQKISSSLLAGAYLSLVVAAFLLGGGGAPETPLPRREFPLGMIGALSFAFQSIVVTYDGWYEPAYFAEELVEPSRSLPRSMAYGVAAVTGIYLLINAAFLYALPLPKLAASELPAAELAAVLFGERGQLWLTALSLFALPPSINACLLGASRILMGLSREGLFWKRAAAVNKGGTPYAGLAVSVALSLTLVMSGGFERLLAMGGFFFVTMHCSAFAALFILRRREPQLPRPFRAPFYPWSTATVLVIGAGFLVAVVITDTTNSLLALGFLALSGPLYAVFQDRPEGVSNVTGLRFRFRRLRRPGRL
jgi:APA family basic amino acid/polyamine antiporter